MTNIAKHASADQVLIDIHQRSSKIELTITDNGNGADIGQMKNNNGLGLIGMRERVETLDGSFSVLSTPEQGFRIYVTLPFSREEICRE